MAGVSGTTAYTTKSEAEGLPTIERTVTEDATYAQHSLEITRGQTGKTGWSIKMYFEPGKEAETLEAIKDLDAKLRAHFGGE